MGQHEAEEDDPRDRHDHLLAESGLLESLAAGHGYRATLSIRFFHSRRSSGEALQPFRRLRCRRLLGLRFGFEGAVLRRRVFASLRQISSSPRSPLQPMSDISRNRTRASSKTARWEKRTRSCFRQPGSDICCAASSVLASRSARNLEILKRVAKRVAWSFATCRRNPASRRCVPPCSLPSCSWITPGSRSVAMRAASDGTPSSATRRSRPPNIWR